MIQMAMMETNVQNSSRFVFIELGTKIVCSECPKISIILNELYSSGDYPFYYVSLPQDNPKALERINDYNIWGYPTAYIDGGSATLVGSTIEKADFEKQYHKCCSENHSSGVHRYNRPMEQPNQYHFNQYTMWRIMRHQTIRDGYECISPS